MLKSRFPLIVLGLAFALPLAHAGNAQQSRMADCNQQAQGKKGEDRKAFMSACLSGQAAATAKPTPQQRMKDCNQKAAGRKGEDRKTFMSQCLKG